MHSDSPSSTAHASGIILTINGGSSGIKFAAFSMNAKLSRVFDGEIERVGTPRATLSIKKCDSSQPAFSVAVGASFNDGLDAIVKCLNEQLPNSDIAGIGHRVVQGGPHLLTHQPITASLIAELRRMQPIDLEHLPSEIAMIEAFRDAFPTVRQFVCFDTAFHRDLPHVAQLLPIPRRYQLAGVRRFGFHGLSYTYLLGRLTELAGSDVANGRIVFAHLGSGSSMAAVRGGKPIDTTMSFTPTSGLVMGSRPGDLDPGLLLYLMNEGGMNTEQAESFISRECGMRGVSETSTDMRDLLAIRDADPRAADAIDLVCYQAKKHLSALAAALGGIDTIVFSGGIGERSPEIRAEICSGLEFLGFSIDAEKNGQNLSAISTADSRVGIRVIPTDEQIVIARFVRTALKPELHQVGDD